MDIDPRIVELLLRHEELQAQGRPAALEELCRDCPELLAPIRQHLRRLQAIAPVLESQPPNLDGSPPTISYPGDAATDTLPHAADTDRTRDASPQHPPPTSSHVPGYEILGELGRGGMGVVYKARQVKANRVVALKMILAGAHADRGERARFRTEAESIARLQHPNIVQVFEVGEHNGLPFFSLEYCSGGTLAKKLSGKPLPAPEAAHLVEQLARAMHAAHTQQVIHRDLKPANVLLAACGLAPGAKPQAAVPKITDFGLAKKLDDGGQTRTGAVMGSPSYMAPEQAAGNVRAVGPLTDVYALGAILYECLTGRPPFTGPSVEEIVLRVCREEPVTVRQLQPRCPRELETICLKCLQKEPGKRYASALALAEDLSRFQAGEPIRARPVGPLERTWRWCRRNPHVAGLLLAVFLTLALGAGGATYFAVQAEDARRREERRANSEREAKEKAEQALAVAEFEKAKAKFVAYSFQLDAARQAIERGKPGDALDRLSSCDPALRQWEHAYLSRLAQRCLWTGRHAIKAHSACFSPNGKWVASGGSDSLIKLWDAGTGREVRTFKGHTSKVLGVCFSPDGTRIVSGGTDDRVKVWDVTTGQERLDLKAPPGGVMSVHFSADGTRIVSAHWDGTARVWDVRTGQELLVLAGHGSWVMSASFSPDGRWIASGSQDGLVRVWDAQTGKESRTLKGHGEMVWGVCFSPDSRWIASGGADTMVRVWETMTGREMLTLRGHSGAVGTVRFSRDGTRLLSGSHGVRSNLLKLWDARTGQDLITFPGHTSSVLGVDFSPDGRRIVSASGDQTVKVWDARLEQEPFTLPVRANGRSNVCFSPDSKRVAVASDQHVLKVWDARTGEERFACEGAGPADRTVCFSPDGRWLAAASGDQAVAVWDAATGKVALTLRGHSAGVQSTGFSPDSSRIAVGCADGTIRVWDTQTGQAVSALGDQGLHGVTGLAFHPDGRRLVAGSFDNRVTVWDLEAGREVLTLSGHTRGVHAVAVSPDGKWIASGSIDDLAIVWDADTGARVFTLRGHGPGAVRSVCFSADGKRLATGGGDKTVKLWDVATGEEALTLRPGPGGIGSVCFSPDGRQLAAATFDWKVKVWDASPP